MKNRIFARLALLTLFVLMAAPALGQRIDMDDVFLSFEYPDTWLVVSPQLARVYAPLLRMRASIRISWRRR